jgi:hypothetical protein
MSEWVTLAARAGFPTRDYVYGAEDCAEDVWSRDVRLGPSARIRAAFAVGDNVVGAALTSDLQRSCLELARLSGAALLGVGFAAESAGRLTFAGATPFPDLRLGGNALLDALAAALLNGSESRAWC